MTTPVCSVIVLSYNTREITDHCLRRLKEAVHYTSKNTVKDIEVIVIDNASTDGSAQMIKNNHPWVTLIISKTNTGFSKGNNIGMKKSGGRYILLLNSDAFVEEKTLFQSIEFFEKHNECDVIGCQLRFLNCQLQPSAGYLPNPLNISLWITGLANLPVFERIKPIHPKNKSFFATLHEVEWVTGAFFMLRRKVFETTKGFDRHLFMYGEEVEWCRRILTAGFHIWYVPSIIVTHIHKASSQDAPDRPFINEVKSFSYYFRKYYPSGYLIIKIIMIVGLLFRAFAFALLVKPARSGAYIKSLFLLL